MTRIDRRSLLLGAGGLGLGLGLSGCAELESTLLAEQAGHSLEGGIGGTGIVGTVTARGSLIVNGLRVALDDSVAVADALGPRPAHSIGIGHSVTVEAETVGERLIARRLHADYPAIGEITRLTRDGRHMHVNGVQVYLEDQVNSPVDMGDRVAVAGLWHGDRVIASRIDRLGDDTADGPSVVAGALSLGAAGPMIGTVSLVSAPGVVLPAAGRYLTAYGRASGRRFTVERVAEERFSGAAGGLARLSVEGYLAPDPAGPGLAISGLGHSFDAAARPDVVGDRRAVFVGPYRDAFEVAVALPIGEGLYERHLIMAEELPIEAREGALSTR